MIFFFLRGEEKIISLRYLKKYITFYKTLYDLLEEINFPISYVFSIRLLFGASRKGKNDSAVKASFSYLSFSLRKDCGHNIILSL